MEDTTKHDKLKECLHMLEECLKLLDDAYEKHLEDYKMLNEKKDV